MLNNSSHFYISFLNFALEISKRNRLFCTQCNVKYANFAYGEKSNIKILYLTHCKTYRLSLIVDKDLGCFKICSLRYTVNELEAIYGLRILPARQKYI